MTISCELCKGCLERKGLWYKNHQHIKKELSTSDLKDTFAPSMAATFLSLKHVNNFTEYCIYAKP